MDRMTPLTVAPFRVVPTGCGVCRGPIRGVVLACERCGIPLHDGCFLALVATRTEVEILMTTDKDLAVLCRGCRS